MGNQTEKEVKNLLCDFCRITVPIEDETFPEDLYDLIKLYGISKLIWLCNDCKLKKDKSFYYMLNMMDQQLEMGKKLANLQTLTDQQLQMDRKLASLQLMMEEQLQISKAFNCKTVLNEQSEMGKLSNSRKPGVCQHKMGNGGNIEEEDSERIKVSEIKYEDDCDIVCDLNELVKPCDIPTNQESTPNTVPKELSDKAKSKPVAILKDVLKTKIKINVMEAKKSKAILKEFLDDLMSFLKENDPIFKHLYQKLYYAGSFYEDLRISSANEFDINLILKFPFKEDFYEVEFLKEYGPFATYKLKAPLTGKDVILSKLFEAEYLMPEEVRKWMQSLIDKTLKNARYKIPNSVVKITQSASGPAKTIKLEISSDFIIDIDLVPVLQFSSKWPETFDSEVFKEFAISQDKKFMFLVPKSLESSSLGIEGASRTWRVHFPEIEKAILHDMGCTKPLVKLLKLLRNIQNWKILASYYLKTIVLWKIRENADPSYWKEDKMFEKLLEVLEKLRSCVQERLIPNIFFPNFNLIEKMNASHSLSINGCIQRIIEELVKDPQNLNSVFSMC